MKTIIKWKLTALILIWALLGVLLKVINLTTTQMDRATFGVLLIAVASYFMASVAMLKPLIKEQV
jgi:hypothetical protein